MAFIVTVPEVAEHTGLPVEYVAKFRLTERIKPVDRGCGSGPYHYDVRDFADLLWAAS